MLLLKPKAWKAEFLTTKLEIERARRRASRMATSCRSRRGLSYPYRSFMRGKGMMVGLLGEEIVKSRYAGFVLSKGKAAYDYDLLHDGRFGRTEVKTKQCGSPPELGYFCSVAESSINQECDHLAFVRVLRDFTRAWFIGIMPREDFLAIALRFKKGEKDPTAPKSTWQFAETCYNVTVKDVMQHPCNRALRQIQIIS